VSLCEALKRTGEFQRCTTVLAHVWFNIHVAMTSGRHLSFTSVEIDKNYSSTLPWWKCLCHRWSHYQLQRGSFSQWQGRQKRESLGTRLFCVLLLLVIVVGLHSLPVGLLVYHSGLEMFLCGLWLVDFDSFCLILFFKVHCLSSLLWLAAAKSTIVS